MTESNILPVQKDFESVGTRISWGAILAGAFVALGMYFLFGIVGAAVGLTIGEHVNPGTVHVSVIAWTIGVIVVSLFVGGLVTSQFTVGEDKIEAILYGVIMWAFLFSLLIVLGAVGVRSNFHTIMTHVSANAPDKMETATHVAWLAFAGVWISMFASAAGALVGAGPTFRPVRVSQSRIVSHA